MNTLKLRPLIEGFDPQSSATPEGEKPWSVEEKKAALEAIGRYNEYGNHLRREHNLMEIAHTLSEIAKHAQKFALSETEKGEEGWFDNHTVSKNMQQLQKISEEFNKLAKDAHVVQQRMEALYEDGGHVLSRYFEIKDLQEGVGPAVSKIGKQ